MNYVTIRDRIYNLLTSVSGIGKVYKSPRYATEWATYLEQFKVRLNDKDVICVCWITRYNSQETETPGGGRSERGELTSVDRVETWQITLVYGFDDDDNNPSEFDFQNLLDAIQEKFRFEDFLGMPDTVRKSWPVQVQSTGLYQFGDVLCHRADMSLKVQQ